MSDVVGIRARIAPTAGSAGATSPRYVSLFWRLFVPNATVLGVAGAVLWVQPANGRVIALAGGLVMMLAVNWLLMRRAVAPLLQLAHVMKKVDPLDPGRRVAVAGPDSEVAVLAEAFNDMLDRIEMERRESGRRALAAQEQERRRLSRELHDEIGQELTAHSLHLDRIADAPAAAGARELHAARETAQRLIQEVRNLAQSLRPDVLDNLGLTSALANLLERLAAQTGVKVEWTLANDLPPLDEDTELVIYRVAQEAITNVIRHANARTVTLTLAVEDDLVSLTIADDGDGIPDAVLQAGDGSGSGIRFMRERALLVGARLSFERPGTGGSELNLRVPLEELKPAKPH